MNSVKVKLSVFYEGPFWVSLIEKIENDQYQIARVVFGAEPKDYEVYEYFLKNYLKIRFSKPIQNENFQENKINPKRLQRKIKKEVQNTGTGTKAQQALKAQQEENKKERKKNSKAYKEEQKRRKFELKQEKKKEKKKGH